MSTATITDSAVPKIRGWLVAAVRDGQQARSQRTRMAAFAKAYALQDCLRELYRAAGHHDWPDGVEGRFVGDEIEKAGEWLSSQKHLLGSRI